MGSTLGKFRELYSELEQMCLSTILFKIAFELAILEFLMNCGFWFFRFRESVNYIKHLNPYNRFCNQKINQYSKNIIAGGNKRSRRQGWIDTALVQEQGNESPYKTRHDDHRK